MIVEVRLAILPWIIRYQVLRGSPGYLVYVGGSVGSHSSMGYQVLKKGGFVLPVGVGASGGIQCM